MLDPIIIELSGAPVGKGRPRFVRSTGTAFTPAKTRSYESHLRLAAQEAMGSRRPIDGPISVRMTAALPVPKSWSKKDRAAALLGIIRPTSRPDADNYLKLCDAFNEIVFRDDSQVVEASVRKTYSDKPSLRIEIRELNGKVTSMPSGPSFIDLPFGIGGD